MIVPRHSHAQRFMQRGLDVLTVALMVVIVARALLGNSSSARAWGAVATVAVFAAVYLWGRRADLDRPQEPCAQAMLVAHSRARGYPHARRYLLPRGTGWLFLLELAWVAVLFCSPDGVWLAFPLFFLHASAMRFVWGYLLAALTVVGAVAASAWWADGWTVGGVVGPVIGAGVAVGVVKIVASLAAESERRQRLIDELLATQAELSVAERAAGAAGERERLAREIHDTLAQGFSSIQLLTRAVNKALDRGEVDVAWGYVGQIDQAAHENLEEARRFVWELASPQLEGSGLAEALVRLGRQVSDQSGCQISVEVYGDVPPLSPAVDFALLRIAQAAVANAVEHAATPWIVLTLNAMEGMVTLDIVDQGLGFDPETVAAQRDSTDATQGSDRVTSSGPRGFGLAGMRARAEAVGGRLSIESSPGAGTAIAVEVPVAGGEPR